MIYYDIERTDRLFEQAWFNCAKCGKHVTSSDWASLCQDCGEQEEEKLRDWIAYQWAFKCWYFFWPTEAQIVQIAGWFNVLCETVIEECDAEFIRHCEPEPTD